MPNLRHSLLLARSLALLGVLATLGLAAPRGAAAADCCLYWSSSYNGTIGRAPLRGYTSQWDFIEVPGAAAFGLAVDREHLYWGGDGSLGRVGLDGSDPEPDLIEGLAGSRLSAIAVDGAHVYWAELLDDAIGRATSTARRSSGPVSRRARSAMRTSTARRSTSASSGEPER
jgi:hypothetical protein